MAPNGLVGYIVPNTILTQEYYQEIRKLILSRVHIDSIVSYEKLVFANAVVETVTLILSNTKSNKQSKISLQDKNGNYSTKLVKQKTFANNYRHQFSVTGSVSDNRIKTKIHQVTSLTFQDICLINQAIALRANRAEHLFDKKRGADYKPVLDGREIQRYQTCWAGKYLKYDINAIHSCKREDIFTSDEKIFFRRVSASLIGTLDLKQYYALNTLVVMNKKEHINYNIRFILGVFNSKLINYYYCTFLKSTKTVFSEIQARQIGQIPFPNLDLSNPSHKATHNTIVRMVDELLRLYNEKAEALVSPRLHRIEERITYCEDKINQLVYQLYGLTDDEIKIVEGG
ncbi:hypothetical protein FACS1894189_4950 [Planctomycetales bacterium]|nr:hypothetical protein FACS1894189_4950 [Planctomycetales bacterium]